MQTRVMPNEEVYANKADWIDAIMKEIKKDQVRGGEVKSIPAGGLRQLPKRRGLVGEKNKKPRNSMVVRLALHV